MTVTDALVELTQRNHEAIPADVLDRAKTCIRDVVGVSMYGSRHEVGTKIARFVDRTSGGDTASVFGHGTCSPPGAALANGTFAHAIDYDDTFESITLHPSAPVFPAALSAAETADATGRDLLTGYVLGVEAAFRVGHSVNPSHYDHGWHITGTVGSFGSAAAASSVLDLSAEQIQNAFGIVASGSSSLKKNFGSMTKPLHPGHAAQTGLRAAMLAADEFTADSEILDGEMGYGEVMSPDGRFDPTVITDGRESWGILDIGFKPYPSGVISHAAMEAMRHIVLENDLTPADVSQISVTLDAAASDMLIHDRPENELQAKFSIEFCLAAVLRERDPGIGQFTDEYVGASETREAVDLVDTNYEPNIFGDEFAGYGAKVSVETTDGTQYVNEERRAPGSPSNPLPEDRWVSKFKNCTSPILDEDEQAIVLDTIDSLEEPGSLTKLAEVLR